jgi:hypothetical protein
MAKKIARYYEKDFEVNGRRFESGWYVYEDHAFVMTAKRFENRPKVGQDCDEIRK